MSDILALAAIINLAVWATVFFVAHDRYLQGRPWRYDEWKDGP